MVDEGKVREAIRILLPRDLQLGNAEFDALKPGDGVRARILRSQFQTNDDYIRATGLFDGLQPSASGPVEALVPAVEDTEAVVKLPGGSNSAAGGPIGCGRMTLELYGDGTPRNLSLGLSGSTKFRLGGVTSGITKTSDVQINFTITSQTEPKIFEIWKHSSTYMFVNYLGNFS